MVELHGWALIRENYTTDNEDANLGQIINHITQEIQKLGIDNNLLQISYSNGEAALTATKFTNHYTEEINKIIEIYKQIATIAPGSYGLLYIRNDEDKNGFSNAFKVFVLSRGTLRLQQDPFLSPYCPIVED